MWATDILANEPAWVRTWPWVVLAFLPFAFAFAAYNSTKGIFKRKGETKK